MKSCKSKEYFSASERGLSLIDVIVGTGLMLLVFTAVFGVLRLSVNVVAHSKARIGATAIAQEQIEMIRSFPYGSVGTNGGIPAGEIDQLSIVTLNDIAYTRRTFIQYVDDPKDGSGDEDENGITADYKRVKVEVTWVVGGNNKSLSLITDIMPVGIESVSGGGTLVINVFDSLGAALLGASVHIENTLLNPSVSVDVSTNENGKVVFPGSPSSSGYEITVSKDGYSSAQTYAVSAENPNPSPGHLSVLEGETTSASFQVDLVSTKIVRTFSPIGENYWTDTFDSDLNISKFSTTTVSGGALVLEDFGSGFEPEGFAYSQDISPDYLAAWMEVSWNDIVPADTNVVYRLYYYESPSVLATVPDTDLPGNTAGFSASPINISSLNIAEYDTLQIAAFLETADASSTPFILDWTFSYNAGPTPISNVLFHMRGTKTIGSDGGGNPIYKYDRDLQTGGGGTITTSSLEWDNYTISVNGAAIGSDIAESCTPQPRGISPGVSVTTDIFLLPHTPHSLLVSVTDVSGNLIPDVNIRLYRFLYNAAKDSSTCGQAFWSGLAEGTVAGGNPYSIDVSKAGYTSATISNVEVSGASKINIVLE